MTLTDAQLVSRTISGDDSAFDELVSRYRSRVYYLALSRVRSREIALDLAQDAFVQAYMSLQTLRSPEKFASWLASIARNLCLMYLRAAREVPVPDDAIDSLNSWTDDSIGTAADAAAARDALNKLPNGARSAAILYFIEEMKQTEIAEFLGISLPAVKSRIREARTRLQKGMVDVVRRTVKKDEPGDELSQSLQQKLELARWYREFSDLISNGVPIMSALDTVQRQGFSEPVRSSTSKLMEAIQSGSSISDALKDLPALTTSQAVGMVRAGEIGGILDWTAQFLADWIEIENGQRELELAFWCRTIGSVVSAGAPARMALECGLDFVRSRELKQVSSDLVEILEAGGPLESVLAKHAGVLLPIVQVSILAGEETGVLGFALQWAANAVHARMAERLLGRESQPPTPTAGWMKPSVEAFAKGACKYLHSGSPDMRAAAATIVGRLGVAECVEEMLPLMMHESPRVRIAVIHALADSGSPKAPAELQRGLGDAEPPVRRAAIDALAAMRCSRAAPDIARLIADPDQRVANTAINALDTIGETDTLTRTAIELLGSDQVRDRIRAAHILLWHPIPDAADALVKALDDECDNVVWTSARALARLSRKEAISGLVKMLEHPHPHFIQREAAEALAELGDPSAAPHIRKAIEEGRLDPSYAWTAEKLEGK
ncbi:MAG TPA: sigma-70 family RNA polymerase sigma factor [Armatimonadota bacterium]|nr:sigma-70 family RNA polymerase sigma factor [Armatimonadota bacterium]